MSYIFSPLQLFVHALKTPFQIFLNFYFFFVRILFPHHHIILIIILILKFDQWLLRLYNRTNFILLSIINFFLVLCRLFSTPLTL